ncbi:hypothetical protein HN011_010234 [Eciton burchellii]|nr:hypothetical protein HN011_010234 [Eciton burchellii]
MKNRSRFLGEDEIQVPRHARIARIEADAAPRSTDNLPGGILSGFSFTFVACPTRITTRKPAIKRASSTAKAETALLGLAVPLLRQRDVSTSTTAPSNKSTRFALLSSGEKRRALYPSRHLRADNVNLM